MLEPLCDQTNKKIFICKARRRLKEICVVKQQPQKSYEQDILQKRLQIDRSLRPTERMP